MIWHNQKVTTVHLDLISLHKRFIKLRGYWYKNSACEIYVKFSMIKRIKIDQGIVQNDLIRAKITDPQACIVMSKRKDDDKYTCALHAYM